MKLDKLNQVLSIFTYDREAIMFYNLADKDNLLIEMLLQYHKERMRPSDYQELGSFTVYTSSNLRLTEYFKRRN